MAGVDALGDDDFSLALYLCYEALYRGETDQHWEWDPALQTFRAELEHVFEDRLRDEVVPVRSRFPFEVVSTLDEMGHGSAASSLATYLLERGTFEQLREFCIHQTVHHLNEVDRVMPRTPALVPSGQRSTTVAQRGGDIPEYDGTLHSTLYGQTMAALGLDAGYGSYVNVLPGVTLASANMVSMLTLHPRWRAAFVGHQTMVHMTSVVPMRRYSETLRRFGVDENGRRFFDMRASTDERRLSLVRDRVVVALIRAEPEMTPDLLFGAAALLVLEQRFATYLLDAWTRNQSSLVSRESTAF
jgi:hypothetical protein